MIRDSGGRIISGKDRAASREQLVQTLIDRGYWVMKVEEALQWPWEMKLNFWFRPREQEITLFFQQMAALTGAGISVLGSLQILHSQASAMMQPLLASTIADVERGIPLWQALDNRGPVFSPVGVQMIRGGEWSGTLGEALGRLAEYMKKQQQFGKQIRSASLYPALLGLLSMVALVFIITFIIPRITAVLGPEAHLPIMTAWLLSCADFLADWGVVLFLVCMVFVTGGIWWWQKPAGRMFIDNILLAVPVVGKIIRQIEMARIMGSLGVLLKSGLTIIEALAMTEKLTHNLVVRQALVNVGCNVSRGMSMGGALLRSGFFHDMLAAQMVVVGEETGLMDEALSNAAQYYEGEAQAAVAMMITLLEPMLMLFMALVVGSITIGCILPMLDVMTIF